MAGTLPTNWLDALNFGTGVAETSSTLGTDRLDTRVPPDQYHIGGLQQARYGQLLLLLSQYLAGGARIRIIPNAANQFAVGESGFQVGSTGLPQFVYNGGASRTVVAGVTASATFDGTQDTVAVTWTARPGQFGITFGVTVTDGVGPIIPWFTSVTATGCTVNVSSRFTGTVDLVLFDK